MTKIHLIRHGQSEFNAAFALDRSFDPMITDAPLTTLGRNQAVAIRDTVAELGITKVICSPMTRALQTARLIFPVEPIEIHADAREHLGHSCDVGRAPSVLTNNWPGIVFDHLAEVWWHQGPLDDNGIPVEPRDVFKARMAQLGDTLRGQDARPLAVVCHGHVIEALTGTHPDNCGIVEFS